MTGLLALQVPPKKRLSSARESVLVASGFDAKLNLEVLISNFGMQHHVPWFKAHLTVRKE